MISSTTSQHERDEQVDRREVSHRALSEDANDDQHEDIDPDHAERSSAARSIHLSPFDGVSLNVWRGEGVF